MLNRRFLRIKVLQALYNLVGFNSFVKILKDIFFPLSIGFAIS